MGNLGSVKQLSQTDIMLCFFKILKFRLRKGEPKVAVSRSIHFVTYPRRTGPRDPKRIDYADKVKPNDVADSSFRQPDWSCLKSVSQVAI